MKVIKSEILRVSAPTMVMDCLVDRGLVPGGSASLPDIDVDYASDRRQEMKEYLEERYNIGGKQRVFSAGTFSTLKLKAAMKDVARVHRVPLSVVNYITAIFEDNMDWTGLFRLAAVNPKVRRFILDYPQVIEDVRGVLGQPKAASIHASAIIVTPDNRDGQQAECFDFLPIRRMDGLLVSEFDGAAVDEIGLLKEDVLATKELAKLSAILALVEQNYGRRLSIEHITSEELKDEKTYRLLSEGYTQNVFQFASRGITRFMQDVQPTNIEDLIAINALYRPATLDIGATEDYIRYKRGEVAPVYNFGCYEATKDTYGLMVYQENFMSIAHTLGGFDMGKTDLLRKAIGKKKADLMATLKDDFIRGAVGNGCPEYEAEEIWHKIEAAGGYSFNRCISGKESLYRPYSGRWQPTIAEMYRVMNDSEYARRSGHAVLRQKYRRNGYGVAFSLNENNSLVKNQIKDIRYMGQRPVYRITLADGKAIDVTDNHTHPTQRGKVRTDELIPGQDQMFVNIGHIKKDTSFRFTDKGLTNNPEYHDPLKAVPYQLNSRKGECGFVNNPKREYVRREYYRRVMMSDYCDYCLKDNCRLEIHHVDHDHSHCGTYFDNLVTLCVSCHKKAHYEAGRRKWGEAGLGTQMVVVQSVSYIGEDDVYDVEMEAPNHTFLTAQGVVTCNSHSAAYALTAYCGAWLKANYPSAFYTVALQWADDKEIPSLMSEMELCSQAKIVPPDINVSDVQFFTDYKHNRIFWSLNRIKMCGVRTAEYIVAERQKNGPYTNIENFIHRIFRYKLKRYEYWDDPDNAEESERVPVNARHMKHLILAGCFDALEKIESVTGRYGILKRAAAALGFSLADRDFPADSLDKHYFWAIQQITVSGIGAIDYRRIFDNDPAREKIKGKASYMPLREALILENEGRRIAVCATVLEVEERSYKDKNTGEKVLFAKLQLQQNNDLIELICWNDFYAGHRKEVLALKDRVVILTAIIRYSDYTGTNCLNTYATSILSNL